MELKMKVSKKTWKRWLAAVLSICLCLSCFQTPVLAREVVQSAEKETQEKQNKVGTQERTVSSARISGDDITQDIIDSAIPMSLNQKYSVMMEKDDEGKWYSFTPDETMGYVFRSEGDTSYIYYPYGELFGLNEEGEYEEINYGYPEEEEYPELDYDANHYIFSSVLEKGKTYYLYTSGYIWSSNVEQKNGYQIVVEKRPTIQSVEIIENEDDFPVLENEEVDGTIKIKISYDDNIEHKVISCQGYSHDIYDNEISIEFESEEEENNYYKGLPGNYTCKIVIRDADEDEGGQVIYESEPFQRKVLNTEERYPQVQNIEIGKRYSVPAGETAYKVHIDTSGNYSCILSDSYTIEMIDKDNKEVWGTIDYAGSFDQNKDYYLVIKNYNDYDGFFSFIPSVSPEYVKCASIEPYCAILSGMDYYVQGYNGRMNMEIKYQGTANVEYMEWNRDYSYGDEYDSYGNRYMVEYDELDGSYEYYELDPGDYTGRIKVYDPSYKLIYTSDPFTFKVRDLDGSGYPIKTLVRGKEYNLSQGLNIFKFVPDVTGRHLMYYTKGAEFFVTLMRQNQNGKYKDDYNIHRGKKNTWYIDFVQGGSYYLFFKGCDGNETILLDYYNGATDPNAATKPNAEQKPPKPSTPSTSTPSTNVPKAPSVSNKSTGIPATGISVAKKSIALKKGGKIKLSTIISPLNSTDSVTFTSSKPKVAKVSSSGVVKAKKPGKAKIIITTTSGKTVTVKVKVTKKAVKATKISVKKKLKIKKGTVSFLSYKVNPKNSTDKMKWKSSKKGIVSVDNNGKITAKKKGKAVITVKIGNKKASCKVTVK